MSRIGDMLGSMASPHLLSLCKLAELLQPLERIQGKPTTCIPLIFYSACETNTQETTMALAALMYQFNLHMNSENKSKYNKEHMQFTALKQRIISLHAHNEIRNQTTKQQIRKSKFKFIKQILFTRILTTFIDKVLYLYRK